jgi:hypothetical protein
VEFTATFLLFFYNVPRNVLQHNGKKQDVSLHPPSHTLSIIRSARPKNRDENKQKDATDLSSEFPNIKRHQLSPGLVTVPNVLKGFGRVLAGFLDEDFVTAWVL